MKKIINGKKYDTETAQKVGFYANYGSWRDFSHFEETLYKKKTGEFFLHGIGGPLTHYAVYVEMNTRSGGEKIVPLSYDEAKSWAESNLSVDEYENIFGVVED